MTVCVILYLPRTDSSGGLNYDNALTFIKARFKEKNQNMKRTIYTHETCAINTENIEVVFKAVRKTLVDTILNEVIPDF